LRATLSQGRGVSGEAFDGGVDGIGDEAGDLVLGDDFEARVDGGFDGMEFEEEAAKAVNGADVAGGERVEAVEPEAASGRVGSIGGALAAGGAKAVEHFGGGFAGEGDGGNAFGGDAGFEEAEETFDEDAGLAGAGAGDDAEAAVETRDEGFLFWGQGHGGSSGELFLSSTRQAAVRQRSA
jgi:hypothetical protein